MVPTINDVQMVAIIVALVGLVRAQWPVVDGKAYVFGIAAVFGVGLAALVDQGAGWRAIVMHGLVDALTAAGGMQAIAYHASKTAPPRPVISLKGDAGFVRLEVLGAAVVLGLVVAAAIAAGGCAVPLEEARIVGAPVRREMHAKNVKMTPDGVDCRSLDRAHIGWDAIGKASAFAAGSSGLATWPVKDEGWRIGLGVAAGILAINAVADEVVSQGLAGEWARYCSDEGGQ